MRQNWKTLKIKNIENTPTIHSRVFHSKQQQQAASRMGRTKFLRATPANSKLNREMVMQKS